MSLSLYLERMQTRILLQQVFDVCSSHQLIPGIIDQQYPLPTNTVDAMTQIHREEIILQPGPDKFIHFLNDPGPDLEQLEGILEKRRSRQRWPRQHQFWYPDARPGRVRAETSAPTE